MDSGGVVHSGLCRFASRFFFYGYVVFLIRQFTYVCALLLRLCLVMGYIL